MNYGIPYMGSKSGICESVCSLFPKADNFYDLFGGGFSVSHFMLRNRAKDYKRFHFNEIRPGMCGFISDAIDGKYNYDVFKPEWISREDFFKRKDAEPYIKMVWSFGNNGKDYLYGKDIEGYKKSMHMAVVFNVFDDYAKEMFGVDRFVDGFSITDKRLYLKNRIKNAGLERLNLERLQQLEQLEQLQRLEQLQQLQQLERLTFYSGSYEDVRIDKNSVIYCDPPYAGTAEYDKSFDSNKFLQWANEQTEPVFISEYNIDDKRFKCIASFKKISTIGTSKAVTEKVYVNQAGYKAILNKLNKMGDAAKKAELIGG